MCWVAVAAAVAGSDASGMLPLGGASMRERQKRRPQCTCTVRAILDPYSCGAVTKLDNLGNGND